MYAGCMFDMLAVAQRGGREMMCGVVVMLRI